MRNESIFGLNNFVYSIRWYLEGGM